jgi:hypothetical protein
MFGWKKTAALEAELYTADKEIKRLEFRERELADVIRRQDQLIFQMSQQTSWDSMRPFFQKLNAETQRRMIDESHRMQTILIPEMIKAYK